MSTRFRSSRSRSRRAGSRRSRYAAALTALLLPLAAAVGLAATPAQAAGPTATYAKTSDWGTGWEGKYTITNGGTATITSWRVEFDLPAGTTPGSFWDALLTSSGNHHTFANREYNGTLAPGASASFGFLASGSGTPCS